MSIKPGEIKGKTDFDFFTKELADKYQEAEKRILEFGRKDDREEIYTKDGEDVWIHAVKIPVKAEPGEFSHIIGIIEDISDKKRMENVLKEINRQLIETESIAHIGTWDWNIQTKVLCWSDETHRIFDVERKDFDATFEAFMDSVHPDDKKRVKNVVDDAVNAKEPISLDYRVAQKEGAVRTIHQIARVISNKTGKPIRISGTVQDITEQKEMEKELKKHREHLEELVKEHMAESQRLNSQLKIELAERERAEKKLKESLEEIEHSNQDLEQFAYAASHDLQEPLRMVASYTQLLGKRYKDHLEEDARDFINFAVEGATRMQKMIDGLLVYSRVQTRGKPLEPTDCSSVVEQAISNLEIHIGETHAKVERDELPTVNGDESQLIRLFQNLIDNAIKFRGTEIPRIQVSSSKQGNKWMFSVSDNGIGIDSKYKDRVFLIFQRLHKEEEIPGTGMGLALCRRIVERHGGQIWVDSDLGKGSTFYFTIPA